MIRTWNYPLLCMELKSDWNRPHSPGLSWRKPLHTLERDRWALGVRGLVPVVTSNVWCGGHMPVHTTPWLRSEYKP